MGTEQDRRAIDNHPCFSEEAHRRFARLHLAVAPRCNIQCNYCNRKYDCSNETRPGVCSQVLTPAEGVERTARVLEKIPQTTVVGIAGPGDPLANPDKIFETLRRIRERFPDLSCCISTNGLCLPEYLDTISEIGIGHVTVTMNAVDPAVGQKIYRWVRYEGVTHYGEEASALLLSQQLKGIRGLAERGILCKVNMVLIPGINDSHLQDVIQTVKELGVFLVNVIPLIPVKGSAFESLREPAEEEVRSVQERFGRDIRIMRHCQRCRADAVGFLGEDRSGEFTLPDRSRGFALQDTVRVAVASSNGRLVDQHFGHAQKFLVYDAAPRGLRFIEARQVRKYCGDSCGDYFDDSSGEEEHRGPTSVLADCRVVLCRRIGYPAAAALARQGIQAVETTGTVEDSVLEAAAGFFGPGLKSPWDIPAAVHQ